MNSVWVKYVISEINVDYQCFVDMYLICLLLFVFLGIYLYLKDESIYFIGSLKYCLVWLLFFYGLCNGWIKEGMLIIEFFLGLIVVLEVYFVCLLGLLFIVVMFFCIVKCKIEQIEFYGGCCYFVQSVGEIYVVFEMLVCELNGYYMDQFIFVEWVIDWCGNNNIVDSIFCQMSYELYLQLLWIVMSVGIGGILVIIGCYICSQGYEMQLMVVDLQNLVFFDYWQICDVSLCSLVGSKIEGIGWLCVELLFIFDVVDEMLCVLDVVSVVIVLWLEMQFGCKVGVLIGINMWGVLQLVVWMCEEGCIGLIVIFLCDSGECYLESYYNLQWVVDNIGDIVFWQVEIVGLVER